MRRLSAVRGVYGVFLLVASDAVVERLTGERSRAATVGRVLGARHLAQALALGRTRSRGWVAVGVGIDVLHALSMVAVAAVGRDHRRLAALDGVVAGGWALTGIRAMRKNEEHSSGAIPEER